MNKTTLIAGGCSLVGIAAGGVGGYFLARRQFDATLGDLISAEVEKTKKIYSLQIMQLKEGKPAEPADIPTVTVTVDVEPVVEDPDPVVAEKASKARIDYAGIAKTLEQPAGETIEKNIFTDAAPSKRDLPPRRPDGKFLPKQAVPTVRAPEDPYIITQEEFFENDPDHDQETLLYYIHDNTLVVKADPQESVDIEHVGEVNLTLFPEVPAGMVCSIAVRNEKHHIDYDVELNEGSLVEAMGMGESDDDGNLPASAYV